MAKKVEIRKDGRIEELEEKINRAKLTKDEELFMRWLWCLPRTEKQDEKIRKLSAKEQDNLIASASEKLKLLRQSNDD